MATDLTGKRFKNSWKRIDRAIDHARTMNAQWNELFDPAAQPFIERREGNAFVGRIRLKKSSDNDMALELGEFFYQLRAALDGVAYSAMILDTGLDPPPKVDRVEFPIYGDAKRFADCPFIKLTSFPTDLTSWLESIQPYNIGNSLDPNINELGRRLKLLHDCARKDRHRQLHVLIAGLTTLGIEFDHTPNVVISNAHPLPINFFGDDTDFFGFNATITAGPKTNITLRTTGEIEFGIAELPDHVGQAVVGELERIMLSTRHIVEVFEVGYPL